MTYARIENNIIRETAEFPSIEGRFPAWMQWVDVTGISGTLIGMYVSSVSPISLRDATPYELAGSPGLTHLQFRGLLTANETVACDNADSDATLTALGITPLTLIQKAQMRTVQMNFQLADDIMLTDPILIAGVEFLQSVGVIGTGRAAQILAGQIPT